MVHGVGGGGAMAVVLWLPKRFNSGPSTELLYRMWPRHRWSIVWALIALVCYLALTRPRLAVIATGLLAGATMMWALGLFWPLFVYGRTNLLAAIPWATIAVACMAVGVTARR